MVVTDHSPSPPASKHLETGDFLRAWGGVASLQLGLAATWTGASARGFTVSDLAQWMSAAPARLAGLAHRKGSIEVGRDADLAFFDPDAEWVVDPRTLCHRHPVTPYAGMRMRGLVRKTMLRGEFVFADGTLRSTATGRLLIREGI
jgi:allantoinase